MKIVNATNKDNAFFLDVFSKLLNGVISWWKETRNGGQITIWVYCFSGPPIYGQNSNDDCRIWLQMAPCLRENMTCTEPIFLGNESLYIFVSVIRCILVSRNVGHKTKPDRQIQIAPYFTWFGDDFCVVVLLLIIFTLPYNCLIVNWRICIAVKLKILQYAIQMPCLEKGGQSQSRNFFGYLFHFSKIIDIASSMFH